MPFLTKGPRAPWRNGPFQSWDRESARGGHLELLVVTENTEVAQGDGDRPKGHTSQLEGAPSAQNEDSLSNKINDSVELQPIEQNES